MDRYETFRICVLGGLSVLRSDGTPVPIDELRTGKTMDLLRLLALENGRPVRPEGLIEKLWPKAPLERARGSLRTASCQIRRAVGTNCVVRHPDGLVLKGAWVDVVEFLAAARRVSLAARTGRHSQVLAITRSTETLYAGDFRAHSDDATWAVATRQHVALVRHEMLCEAAASALAARQAREAADFAGRAVRIDWASERAHRLLMAAHAELGEVATALRLFETHRAQLADELGADPSRETQDLHLRLLRGNIA
ncbi:hypothetical protein JCM10369A_21720 [Nocardioides pyridinolyticus]